MAHTALSEDLGVVPAPTPGNSQSLVIYRKGANVLS